MGGIDIALLAAGNRRHLSKAITLVESSHPHDAGRIGQLLRQLHAVRHDSAQSPSATAAASPLSDAGSRSATLPPPPTSRSHGGEPKRLVRVAISGSPGAGKSCFIEALGMHLAETLGVRVGVMAVDPSSAVNGGSILGDKTRMDQLSMHPNAYVRPSPSRGHLGGVTARCWETLALYEAADFDVLLVETVGVGQSEFEVKSLTDLFVLLVPPASGDELQGIKKGIVEMADVLLVTKYDGDKKNLAEHTKAAYAHAVQFRHDCHNAAKPVLCISSEEGTNIPAAWEAIQALWEAKQQNGQLDAMRKAQQLQHFQQYFTEVLVARAVALLGQGYMEGLEDMVVRGPLLPREAAEMAIAKALSAAPPE